MVGKWECFQDAAVPPFLLHPSSSSLEPAMWHSGVAVGRGRSRGRGQELCGSVDAVVVKLHVTWFSTWGA